MAPSVYYTDSYQNWVHEIGVGCWVRSCSAAASGPIGSGRAPGRVTSRVSASRVTRDMRRRRALLAFVCALGAVQGRPYTCGQCPAAFARRPYLDIHMRTHTGERPYQCDACLKRFTQKSSLNIHKRTHTGGCQPRAGLAMRPPARSTRPRPLPLLSLSPHHTVERTAPRSLSITIWSGVSGERAQSAPRPP